MASEPEKVPAGEPQPPGLSQRIKTTVATAREKADGTFKRVEASRPNHASVDIAFNTYERDAERGGGLIAGALAYRFFFWVLPFVLVLVGGLGFLSSASSTAPTDLAKQAGFLGLTAKSISDASASAEKTRFYALLIGLPAMYLASIGFVKALMVAHSLVWGVPRRKLVKKPMAAAVMTAVLITAMLILAVEQRVREASQGPGILVTMFFIVLAAGLWLFVSWYLPHADDVTLWQLVPGALAVAVGIQVVHLVTVYFVAHKVSHSSSTYGPLGAATAILLSLFLIARVIVFGASLNAEMWRRRQARAAAKSPQVPPAPPPSAESVTPPPPA